MPNNNNYCVILAGGRGKRLWPCSRSEYPKQFVDFFGIGRTQLQQTYDRVARTIPDDHIYVTTNDEFAPIAMSQLPMLPRENFLGEPVNRNTAPSVTWACYNILRRCPEANMIVVPSDQAMFNEEAFDRNLGAALEYAATHDSILAMGIRPTRPEPGYGYIQMGDPTADTPENLYTVKSFIEKPEREFARMFMHSGEFLWNTGIFVANVRVMLDHFRQVIPMVFRQIEAEGHNRDLDDEAAHVWKYFPLFPHLSLDYGILENADHVNVMLCDFGWADMGTWHSIYEAERRYDGDNVTLDSEVMLDDCSDCIIKLPKDHLGVISGLKGYIVAEKDNVLMICKKSDSSAQIKKFVNEVQMKYGERFI